MCWASQPGDALYRIWEGLSREARSERLRAALPPRGEPSRHSGHVRGLVLGVVGVVVISPDALIVRSVGVDPWTTILWRGLFTALGTLLLLAGSAYLQRSGPRRHAFRLSAAHVAAGGLFAAASVAFIWALDRTGAANVLVIIAAGPLIASALARLTAGEATPARTWVAGAGVVAGLAVIVGTGFRSGGAEGDLLALAGATCFAGYLTISRAARPAEMTPAIAIGGAGAAIAGLLAGAELRIGAGDLVLLALLGLVILPTSLFLITRATRHLPAPEVNLIALLETVLGPIWVWLVLGEAPTVPVVIGGLIVLVAVTAHSVLALRARAADAATPEPA